MRHFLSPTLPKIVLYAILFFVMPTYYFVCANGICTAKFSFLVILNMLYSAGFGTLTLPGSPTLFVDMAHPNMAVASV